MRHEGVKQQEEKAMGKGMGMAGRGGGVQKCRKALLLKEDTDQTYMTDRMC